MKTVIELSSFLNLAPKINLQHRLKEVLGLFPKESHTDVVSNILACEEMGLWADYNYKAISSGNLVHVSDYLLELINIIQKVEGEVIVIAPEFMMDSGSVKAIHDAMEADITWIKATTLTQYVKVCSGYFDSPEHIVRAATYGGLVDANVYLDEGGLDNVMTQLKRVLEMRSMEPVAVDTTGMELRKILVTRYKGDTDMVNHILDLIALAETI